MKLSQSNFKLRSPDSDSVHSYLIATVLKIWCKLKLRFYKESMAFSHQNIFFFRLLMIERPDYHAIYSSQPQSNDYLKNNADTLM